MARLETVNKIIVHCSDSDFGDARQIDAWHREKGLDGNGYHYVVLNGMRANARPYEAGDDALVETGRALDVAGAHARGYNFESIGICLIGKYHFTSRQILSALPKLLLDLLRKYHLQVNAIVGHGELNAKKTCPNIDMALVRDMVRARVAVNILKGA